MKSNVEVQGALSELDVYIREKIKAAFPMMQIVSIGEFNQDDEEDIVGYFMDKTGILYNFMIEKDNPNPVLSRVPGEKVEK